MGEGYSEETYDKTKKIARDIMNFSRNNLILNLRFMDSAISNLKIVSILDLILRDQKFSKYAKSAFLCDGRTIAYNPISVCVQYGTSENSCTRAYLHMLFHCIFRHFLPSPTRDRRLWNLSCDIAVEGCILSLGLSQLSSPRDREQIKMTNKISKKVNGVLTAEKIYFYFRDESVDEQEILALENLFYIDDHDIWYCDYDFSVGESDGSCSSSSTGIRKNLEKTWQDISEKTEVDLQTFSKEHGDSTGGLMQNLGEINREKVDYSSFLRQFAVMGEQMRINDDEFDYSFYTYGLNLFPDRKMPLIEPLEYKDVKRVREFVIAIDTSGSVFGDEVKKFMERTYSILTDTESFFSKVNIHIIQCDADIQEDIKITSQDEFKSYINNMKLKGFGGTDFRPVFNRVDEMISAHEFQNLKGLIYFTDGWGVFPERMPSYKTAFVFVQTDYANLDVPPWAIKLIFQREELNDI